MTELTLAALKEAADELAYLNSPVEARVTRYGLRALRLFFEPKPDDPVMPTLPATLPLFGVRIIVVNDDELPPRRMEFRDKDGNVTASFDLPIP